MELAQVGPRAQRVIDQVETVIVGKTETVRRAVVALLCSGHLLIEDVPGTGKTMLARAMARSLDCSFKRIQFTPDLLPADITGTSVYNQKTSEFVFKAGPVFANVVLADEINRTTPKTQSSLLECMEEFQVSVDGVTHELPAPFFVIATQNNIEHQGTYPLPEAQLDRFVMRVAMGYPSKVDEMAILDHQEREHPILSAHAVVSADELVEMKNAVRSVRAGEAVREYIVELVDGTRQHPMLSLGASPRGSLDLLHSSQALAALRGRGYVLPDDVKELATSVLAHRLILRPEARLRQLTGEQVVQELLESVPIPVEVPLSEASGAGTRGAGGREAPASTGFPSSRP
jgi:MoxR-like ATPase